MRSAFPIQQLGVLMPAARLRVLAPVLAALLVGGTVPGLAQDMGTQVQVNLSETGCDPSTISVPAGPVVLQLTNAGGDVAEFEILRGDFVVDEAENIVPGFQSDLMTRLDGGEYTTICYSLQAPRGTLTVTGGGAASQAPSTLVDAATLASYQTEYETYVRAQAADGAARVATFVAAIKAGDLDTARSLYATTRVPWETIEPITELFADLDAAIDFREDRFTSIDDPAWTGFHRIERLLWVDGASGDLGALADGLLANANDLAARVATLPIDAYTMAQGAGSLIEEVAQSKMTGEEDRYSGTDLVSIQANVDGSKRIVDIFRPTLSAIAPDYLASLDAALATVDAMMRRYRDGDGFRAFKDIAPDDLTALQGAFAGLAEVLSQLAGTLGLTA
jgi:iron uptake system component EfeO